MKIVRVTAMWCMSCLVMQKIWSEVFDNYKDIEIIDYDYDEDFEKIKDYNIGRILPVLLCFKGEEEVLRIIGEKKKIELMKLLEGIE